MRPFYAFLNHTHRKTTVSTGPRGKGALRFELRAEVKGKSKRVVEVQAFHDDEYDHKKRIMIFVDVPEGYRLEHTDDGRGIFLIEE